MKRIFSIFFISLASITALMATAGQKQDYTIDRTRVDFGTIHASRGPVTAVYRITNTSSSPLPIIQVTNGGCGCTRPSYPVEPIAPGKSAEIKIEFNPAGRRGEFDRRVKLKTKGHATTLSFTGTIIP